MKILIDFYHRLLTWLMVASVAALVIPVSLQIISRYTALIPSYIWTEEMSRFLFIWMVMLGAMVGIREGTHFEVDIWPELGWYQESELAELPMPFIFIAWPLAGATWILFLGESFVANFRIVAARDAT
jgi:TRAP-type C4-dicarboxylate transport system permease small subunit